MVLGQLAGPGRVLHERARADLHVEHERVGALGDLLAHDRAGDQRDRLDRAGDVAQRVELLVGRGQVVAGRADHRADVAQHGEHLLVGQRRPPAGDRLELVERAAGVAQPAAGQLRHGDAAGGDQRRERQRDLVADAAGGVLVGGRPAERGEVHPLAAERSSPRSTAAISRAVMPLSRIAMASAPSARRRRPRGCRRRPPSRSARRSAPRRRAWRGSRRPRRRPRPVRRPRPARPGRRDRTRPGSTSLIGHDAATGSRPAVRPAVLPSSCRQRPHGISGSPCCVDAGDGDQPAAAAGVQRRDHAALGAQADAVGRVLDVAADDDAAVVDQAGHADREAASTARRRAS